MIFEHQSKNKKILFIIFAVVLLGGISFLVWQAVNKLNQVYCTQEAKQCPDGSYVGRVPPECEFAPCPGEMEWLAIKQAIANCKVKSVWQTHDRAVKAELKNGEELTATEPKIDDIINMAEAAEPKCGKILMGTE